MISIINVNNNNINEIIKNLKERSNTINIRKSVEEIIENIKLHGNKALREYTLKFDNVELKDFLISNEEIEEAYEKNTGVLIVDHFKDTEYMAMPAVLCKNHGTFTWGKNAKDAVHNAVVLEEVAKMAARTEMLNPQVQPAPQELQDKHYYRKHGANAYYGQK